MVPGASPLERVIRELLDEYRLVLNYARQVLSELQAVFEASDKPLLASITSSLLEDIEAHETLANFIEFSLTVEKPPTKPITYPELEAPIET